MGADDPLNGRLIREARNRRSILLFVVLFTLAIILAKSTGCAGRLWSSLVPAGGVALDIQVLNKPSEIKKYMENPGTLTPAHPMLDVKILNSTSRILFFDEINIVAERKQWNESATDCAGITAKPTEFYDVRLDLGIDKQQKQFSIISNVGPQKTARLLISLAPSADSLRGSAEFLLTIKLGRLHDSEYSLNPVLVSLNNIADSCDGPAANR